MRAIFAAIIAMAIGFGAYAWQTGKLSSGAGGDSPTAIVDTVAIKTDLLTMAGAERQELALQGKYATLAELRAQGLTVPERRGPYVYSADISASSFTITATYTGQDGAKAPATLTIGPDMQVK